MQKDIEKIIITTFKQRRLEVNPQSFNRLKDMIALKKIKKRSNIYKILGVAATLVIFVFMIGIKTQNTDAIKNKITNINEKSIRKDNQVKSFSKIANNKTDLDIVKDRPIVKNLLFQNKKFNPFKINKTNLFTSTNANLLLLPSKLIIKKNYKFSEVELDTLLASASSKLGTDNIDSLSVDALQMLNEIEIEINKPLPEKVILSFKSGSKIFIDLVNPKNNN